MLVETARRTGPLVLLSRVLDRVTAERVRRRSRSRMGPRRNRLAAEVEVVFRDRSGRCRPPRLTPWADTGIVDPVRPAIVLGSTPSTWMRQNWRMGRVAPITVMTFQVTGAPAGVLLDVGHDWTATCIFARRRGRIGHGAHRRGPTWRTGDTHDRPTEETGRTGSRPAEANRRRPCVDNSRRSEERSHSILTRTRRLAGALGGSLLSWSTRTTSRPVRSAHTPGCSL
jgi:hypothetical protein